MLSGALLRLVFRNTRFRNGLICEALTARIFELSPSLLMIEMSAVFDSAKQDNTVLAR
jgi:hypothetical protein